MAKKTRGTPNRFERSCLNRGAGSTCSTRTSRPSWILRNGEASKADVLVEKEKERAARRG